MKKEQEVEEFKFLNYEGTELAVVVFKNKVYICPSFDISANFEKKRNYVFYHTKSILTLTDFETLPVLLQDRLNKIAPEIHSKKICFGLTARMDDSCTLFYSKKIKGAGS